MWQVVCGLCAVVCVTDARIGSEPFTSSKAPKGDPPRKVLLCFERVFQYCIWNS